MSEEKSPYLLQHAHNPVDWYPWTEEAFEKARAEDKPIFLSVGYSTCHWCHVMAHESFEDEEVAQLMNNAFVNIKVDREERPDIDMIYMQVAQMMTGRGGWPLTIIMTPDKKPFYADTYIPKTARYNKPGLLELIPRIKTLWKTDRSNINDVTKRVLDTLKEKTVADKHDLSDSTLDLAFKGFEERFDELRGGFGSAPKFPSPHNLLFLMRYWKRTGNKKALQIVEKTLYEMRKGGIYDQVGFGFHRYSTDANWLLPHFEKMLYDQAMHLMAYTEAYQITKKDEYRIVAEEIVTYLRRDLLSSEGGFFSAEDADSEGEEGKFYVWTLDEIKNHLDEREATVFIEMYNIMEEGNFFDEATGHRTGQNIPYITETLHEYAKGMKIDETELQKIIESARQKLIAVRSTRIRPHLDDKVLTDWNALIIVALAKAARVFDNVEYLNLAENALTFINSTLHDAQGILLHRYRDGEATISAFLDDYAFLIWALIELYQTTFKVQYIQQAMQYLDVLISEFWDPMQGGLYFTGIHSEKILSRQIEGYDGAIPSGNSVAMYNLIRMGRMLGAIEYEDKAMKIAEHFSSILSTAGTGFSMMLIALEFSLGPTHEIVIAGDAEASETIDMISLLSKEFLPRATVLLRGTENQRAMLSKLAPYTKYHESIKKKPTAFVCIEKNCKLPTTEIGQVRELLNIRS
ncbi:MAG: thioredoxin domain-containing protein [Candidatus Thorarchaeota archaeon]